MQTATCPSSASPLQSLVTAAGCSSSGRLLYHTRFNIHAIIHRLDWLVSSIRLVLPLLVSSSLLFLSFFSVAQTPPSRIDSCHPTRLHPALSELSARATTHHCRDDASCRSCTRHPGSDTFFGSSPAGQPFSRRVPCGRLNRQQGAPRHLLHRPELNSNHHHPPAFSCRSHFLSFDLNPGPHVPASQKCPTVTPQPGRFPTRIHFTRCLEALLSDRA
jgi:hypothetical protein